MMSTTRTSNWVLPLAYRCVRDTHKSHYWVPTRLSILCFPIGSHKSLSHTFLLAVTSRCLMLSYWQSQVVVSCLPIGSHKSLSHAFLLAVTSRCLISPYFYIVLRYHRTCSRPEYAKTICHCAFCNR